MKKSTVIAFVALVLSSCGHVWVAGEAEPPRQELRVDMEKVIQADFLGVNAVYLGFAFMPEQVRKGMSDADRKREFDRIAGMKLNIARTPYFPEWVQNSDFESGRITKDPYNWDSEHMKAFYAWLKEMKDRDVDVALNLGWHFPQHSRVPPSYPEWVSESLHQFVEVRGFTNVKYGILFTEPQYSDAYRQMALALDERLKKDGRRKLIKLVGPNQTGEGPDLDKVARDLDSAIDIYSSHTYNHDGYAGWKKSVDGMMKKVAATGKPFWYDEYGRQHHPETLVGFRQTPEYGNYLAQAAAAFINAGAQASTVWILFDTQWAKPYDKLTMDACLADGVDHFGLCKWPPDKAVSNPTYPHPSWYAFSMMSRYLGGRNGTKVYQTTNSTQVVISAVQQPAGDWSFLAVNCRKTVPIQVKLSKPLNRTLYRYLYNPYKIRPSESAEIIGYSRVFTNVVTDFADTLPHSAVAVYSTIPGAKAKEEIPRKLASGIKEARCSSCDDPESAPLHAFDGDPATPWHAGGYPPAWVECVMEKKTDIAKVSAIVCQGPTGETVHDVIATFADGSQKTVHTFQGQTKMGDVLRAAFSPPLRDVTAIRILTKKSPSWVSWFEICLE